MSFPVLFMQSSKRWDVIQDLVAFTFQEDILHILEVNMQKNDELTCYGMSGSEVSCSLISVHTISMWMRKYLHPGMWMHNM